MMIDIGSKVTFSNTITLAKDHKVMVMDETFMLKVLKTFSRQYDGYLVYDWYDDRYWSKVLFSNTPHFFANDLKVTLFIGQI